ncbi:MAG: hypothetical protein AAF631_02940 [Pseudomonadota bacterium]
MAATARTVASVSALPFDGKAQTQAGLDVDQWAVLNRLRFHAVTCRAAARLDIFEACRTIDPAASEAHMVALVRVLGQALDGRPIFYKPGTTEFSFDERWLMAVFDASCRNDRASLSFLVCRRIRKPKRRAFLSLMDGLNAA